MNLYSSPAFTAYCVLVCALVGLCMGSFLNCLAWRLTHNESVLKGRSHCTSCGHVLGPLDLIPVLSWVLSKGKCRYCGEKVSARYPLTEILCAIIYVSILLRYGLTLETVELIAFASVLLVLTLTDLDSYIIPNPTIICAIVIRVVYLVVSQMLVGGDVVAALLNSLVSGLVVGGGILLLTLIMDRVLGRESLGGGDIKLLFVAGLYFGWVQCLFLLVLACVVGIVFAFLGGSGTAEKGKPARLIPFGPSIAFACWITMLVGEQVVGWYLSLFL